MSKNINENLHPEISVVIPFYGNIEDLINSLNGLKNQTFNKCFEVIVAESGKNPELKKIISSIPNAVLISCETIMYPGKARNLGAANSKSNLIAFIDADCVPKSDWLFEIYTSLINQSEIVIGPVINLFPFHPVASVDNLLQFPDFQKNRPAKNISHFPACNFGITKNLFYQTVGFPENILTGEDVLFSQSVLKKNKDKVFYNCRQIVKHSGRKDLKSFVKHNSSLGFHRGYLNLKISGKIRKNRDNFLLALMFGIRRLIYISARTLQWNPLGIFRIIFFFPFLIIGLSAWIQGFRKGNKKYIEENFEA
ncbi:MAG TPA: glycosyltransferase [Ignavibacteriaceae bacterium]|nr:glycosyltransferase [Ignavibacteriaceae bacterium]